MAGAEVTVSAPAHGRSSTAPTEVANPVVTGPVTHGLVGNETHDYPFASTDPAWLSSHGYVQEEFFVSGTASCYETPRLQTGTVIESGNPYNTRMIVRRPLDRDKSNGVVVVEWLNASSGYEIDSTWAATSYEAYIRAGATWVGLSLQNNVVQQLRAWSPHRYGALNVEPLPGSSCPASADTPLTPGNVKVNNLAYDILSQVGQALRQPAGVDPLHGLARTTLIATGASQSAARLIPYVNSVHPMARVYDGFFLAIPIFDHVIRRDRAFDRLGTPVFKVMSEWDLTVGTVESNDQPDGRTLRTWQIAGAPHTTYQNVQYRIPNNARDDLAPITFCTGLPPDAEPISLIPSRYVFAAAAQHLIQWIRKGTPPPTAPRISTVPGTTDITRDQYGNALGGIRLSQHEVATATNDATGCSTYGWHRPLDQATLATLYPSHRAYVAQVVRVTQRNVRAGYLLQPDARTTILEAEQSRIGS
ncbi:alpha/beta hydrolase domain-containing protein [Actinoplanes aureus]|uniref:alpha/beta hydrolase domain-containing protein n=1 Tax=Actinoplanes aureus TaxID=2792083 RepID=UPI001E54097A|nr:alpha/beta hydrolase domain-containing protein [Actinoplanes aureus]